MKKLLILPLALVLTTACKKKTVEPLELTGKRWHLVALTAAPDAAPIPVDVYDQFVGDCAKDDYIFYRADSTVYYDDGVLHCDPNQQQRIDGVWRFRDNNKRLLMQGYSIAGVPVNEVDVLELTSDKMVIKYRYFGPEFPVPVLATGTLVTF